MCNFSNFSNNNQSNQSATYNPLSNQQATYNPLSNQQATYNPLSNQQAKTPTTLELIKMAAELAAIDHAADSMIYNPIPISVSLNAKVGDVNISCSINNDAAREKQQPIQQQKPQETQTTTQQQKPQETQTTTQQQKPQETQTTQQQPQQQTTTHQYDMFRQLPEKYHKLYSVVTDFLGSYTKVKISIAPGCSTDSIRLGFINKGESVVKGERPFFGVESIPQQRYFSKNFEYFSIFPRGDAFSVTIKGDEAAVSKLMRMVEEHIIYNKRNVEWARYNN